MNRLNGSRCYLSGAMEFMPDFGTQWRQQLRFELGGMGLVFLDPTNKPIEAIDEITLKKKLDEAREVEDYDTIVSGKEIRHIDLRMCDMADFLIVNLDLTIPTCGTWEELFTANRAKKPILVRVVQGKKKAPSWLFWTIPHQHIFSTWRDIYDYVREVDSGDYIPNYNRWLFFNLTGDCVK